MSNEFVMKNLSFFIVTELNLHLNVRRISNEEFILSIVTELNLNFNVKQMSNKEFILSIVTELNLKLNGKILIFRVALLIIGICPLLMTCHDLSSCFSQRYPPDESLSGKAQVDMILDQVNDYIQVFLDCSQDWKMKVCTARSPSVSYAHSCPKQFVRKHCCER